MITPAEFVTKWRDYPYPVEIAEMSKKLNKVSAAALAGIRTAPESAAFLTEAGLPDSAAPCLSFNPDRLPPLPAEYPVAQEFRRYRILGSDGSGNPICIDEELRSSVVVLEHDGGFRVQFMNSSVPQLAECLLAYRDFWGRLRAAGADDDFIDYRRLPKDIKEWICAELERIDKAGFAKGTFWASQVRTND